jgi:hypothetical protein
VQVILHLGAKERDAAPRPAIPDPHALLQWLAPARASAKFRDAGEIDARRSAFADLIRAWVAHAQ